MTAAINVIDINATEEGKFSFEGAYQFKGDATPIPFKTLKEALVFASFAGYSHFKRNGAERKPIPKEYISILSR